MNRRLVNGLLLLTLATGSCSMFTSCKDTDEDWKNQMVLGQVSLEDKIDELQKQIDNFKCTCPDYQQIIDALKLELQGKINELETKLADKADKSEVTALLDKITKAVDRISLLESQYTTLQTTVSGLETLVNGLKDRLDGVDTKISGIEDQLSSLNTLINTKVLELQTQITTINSTLTSIQTELTTLQGTVGNLSGDVATLKTTVTNLQTSLTTIQTSLTNLTNRVTTLETNVTNLTSQVNTNTTAISTLQTNYTDLSTKLTNLETSLGGRIQVLEDYKTNTLEPAITKLNTLYDQINGEDGIAAKLAQAINDINEQGLKIAQNIADIAANKTAIAANTSAIAGLQTAIQGLETTLATHTQQINALQEAVNLYFSSLRDRLNSLITGIILNQTWNPLFGTINLPLGIETSIAANYYGESDHTIEFPLGAGAYEYNGNESVLKGLIEDASAWNNLLNNLKSPESIGYYVFDSNSINGKNQFEIKSNERYMTDVNNNLGQLYLTINPNNVDFSNVNLSLVNSMDEAAPITLDVKKCNDEVLTFGAGSYSRAAENNGFYRANLKVRPADATKIGVRIEDGLKSAMKDALKEHTKGDLARFGKKLVNQLSGVLPAYAIKAEWEAPVVEKNEEGKEVAVNKTFATYSDYNIAATALRPLGYSFLYDVDITDHTIGGHHVQLPTYSGSIEEILDNLFDDLHFDLTIELNPLDKIDPEDFTVNFDFRNVKFVFDKPMTVEIDLNGMTLHTTQNGVEVDILIGGEKGTPEYSEDNIISLTYNPDGTLSLGDGALNTLVDSLVDSLNEFIQGDLIGSLNDQVNEQLAIKLADKVNDIIDQINEMIVGADGEGGIQGSIDSAFQSVVDQIKNTLSGKLGKIDSLIDKYNSLAKRINKILSQPNHYLQVMMAYEDASGNLHHLSTNRNVPSSFRFGSGDAIELFITSYTAELIAPSFAKYVSVSRVFNMKGEKLGDSETIAKNINGANEYLNVLLPGTLQRVPLKAKDLQPGNIYEVVLSSVDYRGYTSSRLYYFMVSK